MNGSLVISIMRQEKSKLICKEIISIVSTILFSIVFFVVLGTFYKAIEHPLAINIIVWIITILAAYYFYYGIYWLVKLCARKISSPNLFDGWSIFAGILSVLVVCLFNAVEPDDYLYVEIMGWISGAVGTLQLLFTFFKHRKKNK